jgi:branched-chain amino acid transport system substrate-binding protein
MTFSKQSIFGAMLALMAGVACTSCSVLVDLDECTSQSSCVEEYGRGWTCTPDNLCERKALLDQTEAGPCSTSEGPVDDPDAFNLGVMLPLSGEEGADGRALLEAIKLAQSDFNELAGVQSRQIGLIICDTQGNDGVALEAGDHLVNDSGVEAIIGPNFSSQTVDVATQYAIPNDVLLVSPSATAVPISNIDDKNLVWRTTPSDALQAKAMGLLVSDLIEEKQAEQGEDGVVKLAVLARQDDVYAQGLRNTLPQFLPDETVNGNEHRYFSTNYQNASAGQGSDYSGVAARVTAQDTPPDVVVILGFAEAWDIARLLDQALDTQPLYVFADAGRVAEQAASSDSDGLEGRVLGTTPRGGDRDYEPWSAFRVKYNSSSSGSAENIQYVANAYDAVYAIALAAAGSGFTGPELAEGMSKLSEGEVILATQQGAQEGMSLRGQGQSIDLQGASGELDFDENGDPTVGAISFWCLRDRKVPESDAALLNRAGEFSAQSCPADTCASPTDCPSGHTCSTDGTCDPN